MKRNIFFPFGPLKGEVARYFLGWYKSNTDGEEMSEFVMRYYHHGEVLDIEAGIRYCLWHNLLGCFL